MKKSTLRVAFAAVAVPAAVTGFAAPAANAVELAPYAHQLDTDVAATEAQVGAAIDALGLAAE
ncbi:MAG TPA: hypothetical protein VNP37_07200 [Actinomycetospora sp.]|nr:hypothetical protein [Actinomycetospora sp.]